MSRPPFGPAPRQGASRSSMKMSRSSLIAGTAVAAIALSAAIAGAASAQDFRFRGPAPAQPNQGQQMPMPMQQEMQQMMRMLQQMQQQLQAQNQNRLTAPCLAPGPQRQAPGPQFRQGPGPLFGGRQAPPARDVEETARTNQAAGLIQNFDTNKDGAVTQDEIDQARTARLKQFDKDGDATG